MALKTETNTLAMERRVMKAATLSYQLSSAGHRKLSVDFEHGQWWVTCVECGAQWSVVDASGPLSDDGFDFERVSEGDEEGHS